ncbi:winged helix DNA-binding domain-containing protein [Nocardioides sp. AX2bis]|uniref:winged helix DNA-binding domain-containing protein n=1 Tax=Nocardioides sp. AX2bis TaxID=2653157 RepID=UPI0012F3CB53|nr:winged helix DNA-binding domain-containing protein [Nocardioides sp. AX2bis]VXB85304.1 conserved hypothetical protein [Nocardioides sp. AX2bis]
MRTVPDRERRHRLGRRHAVAPERRVGSVEQAVRAVAVLHATEPATVHLSVVARADLGRDDVERALHDERSVVKQLAMRRTLFVFPRDVLPAAWGSASARVAAAEGARLAKEVVASGVAADGGAWLDDARVRVLEHLRAHPQGLTAAEVRPVLPGPDGLHSRVLTHLGLTADVVRGTNTSHWRVSRPRWTAVEHWLDDVPAAAAPEDGWAELVRRWLDRFGPGTTTDLVWWLGATQGIVRTALAALGAVEVRLEDGRPAWVLAEDEDPEPEVAPWAALLPVLDPTVMGWKERSFYLGDLGPQLFDRNGNAGTTAWWDGRVVGTWVQDPDGVVVPRLLTDVPAPGRRALAVEAARLTTWLSGERVGTVYPSPAMKAARDDLGTRA